MGRGGVYFDLEQKDSLTKMREILRDMGQVRTDQ